MPFPFKDNHMAENSRHLMICSCDKTMQFDADAVGTAAGFDTTTAVNNLCRVETAKYEAALADGASLCVTCTQESPLFAEIAQEVGSDQPSFVNIREMAGWTKDKASTDAKMAALLAAPTVSAPGRLRTITSDGLCLIAGSGQQAFDIAVMLNKTLSVTLLLTGGADEIVLPTQLDFPVFGGRLKSASGSFGKFDVTLDNHAAMVPSSRGAPEFGLTRDDVKSQCSVIFDMTGDTPLFARHEGRDGYLRADPRDPAAVMRTAFEASDLVGEFEKPIYVRYDADICAHSRSKKTGCSKCIDNCPASAIAPDGDHVNIDHDICGGCGNCAAHCPTGAVSYDYPTAATLISRIQLMAKTYLAAGGKTPVLLLHDASHGAPLINAMARFGRGLPAHVIPMEMHATSGVGHDVMVAALVAGMRDIVVLADPKKDEEYESTRQEIALTDSLATGFGFEAGHVHLVSEVDPDAVETALWSLKPGAEISQSSFAPVGNKREISRAAIGLMAEASGQTDAIFALPESAPYGAVNVDLDACTLCLACVSSCPADALRDNPEMPQLRFVESACVQCGICQSTCPEDAITLEARYNATPGAMQPLTLNESEPAECTRCGTPFASAKMLDRVADKLGGKHWMFDSEDRTALIHMCDSCRLEALSEGGADPFAIANKPRTRTTDDYIDAEKKGLSPDDFLN